MSSQPCPSCGREVTRAIDVSGVDDAVKYYRCGACGHVWATFTDGRSIHHVTPLGEKPPQK